MEGIHGVDVSWLHHSPKDYHGQKAPGATGAYSKDKVSPELESTPSKHESASSRSNGIHAPPAHHSLHRPHMTNRPSSDKGEVPAQTAVKGSKDAKLGPPGRRNSWMSSISSKFSSSSVTPPAGTGAEGQILPKSPKSPQTEQPNPFGAAAPVGAKEVKRAESPSATPPGSPKTGHTFLQSALRRLSSTGGASIGKATGTGGVCPRKTMNIDHHRERCALPDLELAKLRRVAFCVDVEIAGAAQYVEDEHESLRSAPSLDSESSSTNPEKQVDARKKKDQKLKKGEGEALKRPTAVIEEKEKDGVIKATGEELNADMPPEPRTPFSNEVKEPSKKKEKKKRSEGERKERKERKQQEALANGTIPAEIRREGSSGSATESPTRGETSTKGQDRPTTDPLRIYRRCCQLRETPILKRIAEQISSPSACHVATPGILSVLELSGYWMQLPDVITLGDYLAVVPVKKLIMDNCGLGDEAVRVILAGLLAAKTPEQSKHNKRLVKKSNGHQIHLTEQLGVVEKLSLKNNPKIGKEGWRHIALFIYMSRSLKAIDLSMIPFPQQSARSSSVKPHHSHSHETALPQVDMPSILQEAIAGRLGGSHLEELVMAECGLSTHCIGQIVDGVIKCGSTRLGLASNNLSKDGLEHIIRYVRSGKCEGLDIGGNNLREDLDMFAEALDEDNTLWALSLADCQLSPSSLKSLFPALVRLSNFRFIDLSHNRDLFATKPSVLGLIRKYLPQCSTLKRIHLLDVAMSSEHAIALAEVLPECRVLAHLNILENHLLSPLASAKTEANQEEACALFASLMAAVRVSDSIICIDIDVPSQDSSEIVKALAKQVVAYSLRNLERLPIAETSDSAIAAMADPHGGEKELTVPDVLLHLVGHVDGFPENHDNDEPAPDDDYIVGGTGVVKALDICLNRAEHGRSDSRDMSPLPSGTGTPKKILQGTEVSKGKAKEMSKNLLGSARKIRARLQPALIKEARAGNDMSYRRLQFLDSTLERMILRFEDEYPETRLNPATIVDADIFSDTGSAASSLDNSSVIPFSPTSTLDQDPFTEPSPDPSDPTPTSPLIRPISLSRRSSSPSLASRQAQEEGRMHRFGQRLKRDILRPETQDYAHGTTGQETEAEYLQDLRRRLESLGGDEIKERVERMGPEAVYEAIGATAEDLAEWERRDPKGFEMVREARARALSTYGDEGKGVGE